MQTALARVPCLTGGGMASADQAYEDVKKKPALISVTTAKEKIALYDGWTAYEQVGLTFKISIIIYSWDIALMYKNKMQLKFIYLSLFTNKKERGYIFNKK